MVSKVRRGLVSVPVFWISRHPEILARGYFDQGLIEYILDRSLWTPPNALEFDHQEIRTDEWPAVKGALVILPCRHHASPEDVEWFKGQLSRLDWYVCLLCGDESWEFPALEIPRDASRRAWVMQPRPEHSQMDGFLPGGPYPNTREWIVPPGKRSLDWMFAGQVTHSRRIDCVKELKKLSGGSLRETNGYLQGILREMYTALLSNVKVMPCPSGPMTVDTARPLEGMEAGCVPVVDMVTPRGESYDYWTLCFGEDCPLTRIWDWSDFPEILSAELEEWPHNSNRVFAWWQGWKRKMVYDLDAQIREVMGD